jgi:tRNA nucleotidyltransferase (CCA-adding enzyme)
MDVNYNKDMDVILTHEQADFDALASLLGASLLHETAIPVLPRRINRNGRSFLTLYGADLPFIDPRDLPGEPIDSITLVDTQSLITLKGIHKHTRIQVIDHHTPRPDLPADWTVQTEKTGASTTLFVEAIHERGLPLNMIQATLLLLGIYEDTGAMTYASTDPRDVRAAAYLLDQGASLQIASNYLNPPLSLEQRKVFDRLLEAAETYSIHGQTIVISSTDATEMTEEISSIAHKLRDFLDPDALILLVKISEGIRIICRSTTDQVDVSTIARHFGGGGHERAAAALIRIPQESGETPMNTLREEVIELLKQTIRPSITIGQIMSRRPYLLSPKTPADDALRLMQRFGYEGYPVVDEDKVIGLLTRRAVDRAIAHRLNLNAASLMEAGEITVFTTDSLEHLQNVMTNSGWGQIPVLDPQSKKVIGIVTRTDLLKALAPHPSLPARRNIASKLETALPPGRLALLKMVAQHAHQQHVAIYIVGGFVRDLLLDRPSLDFDVVVEGDAIALARSLSETSGGRVVSHTRFGTAKWDITEIREELARKWSNDHTFNPTDIPESLDLITARTEFYDHPTALPTIRRSSIKLDLHRRDFTINTLALRLDGRHYGELHDYWGGLSDLQRGIVRVLHSLSFIDDPTRMLRAVRFEQRFGFEIETRTLQLMAEADQLLERLSGERIRHELDLILAEEHAAAMLLRLAELGLLAQIHPSLTWNDTLSRQMEDILQVKPDDEWEIPERLGNKPTRKSLVYILWFSYLPLEVIGSLIRRLKLPGPLAASVLAAGKLRAELPELAGKSPSYVAERLSHYTLPALFVVHQSIEDDEQKKLLHTYATTWRRALPTITGYDLKARGLPPGPIYSEILDTLRAAWLDGRIHSPEEETAFLEDILSRIKDGLVIKG